MQKESEILKLSENYRDYTAKNLSEMVKIKSLSGQEKEHQELVAKLLLEAGCDKVWTDGLGNVIGQIGDGDKILAFDAHIDTVDVGNLDNWQFEPFSGVIRDGKVWGRGTADQKGGAAAFITAAKIIKDLGWNKNITLLFVASVMEEDSDGLCWNYIIEEDKIKPHLVVSTEPTSCNIYRGQRGRMEITVDFKGLSAHGSAPERGINAIYKAANVALEIEKLNEKLAYDSFLGKGTVVVSQFKSGSPSLCAVADYAQLYLDRRLTRGENKDIAISQIKAIAEPYGGLVSVPYYNGKAWTGLEYGMEKYYPTWLLEPNHPFVLLAEQTFENLWAKKPLVDKWTFSTNGVTICGVHNIPVIGFGPGNEKEAHAPNEFVEIDQLVAASAFYAALAFNF